MTGQIFKDPRVQPVNLLIVGLFVKFAKTSSSPNCREIFLTPDGGVQDTYKGLTICRKTLEDKAAEQTIKDFFISIIKETIFLLNRYENDLRKVQGDDGNNIVNKLLNFKKLEREKLNFLDGTFYCGQQEMMVRHGKGTLTFVSGNVYQGEFKSGHKHGYGTFTGDGFRYQGDWLDDYPNGFGTIKWENGQRYEGLLQDGRLLKGTFLFQNGTQFEGSFQLQTGEFEGPGTLTTANEVIKGEWSASQLHGYAERKTIWGDIYCGEWFKGRLNGQGSYSTAQEKYDGFFKDDLEHGLGKKEFADGSYYRGEWNEGIPHGKGHQFNMKTNEVYDGHFENGLKNGKGVEKKGGNKIKDGMWLNNKFHGVGRQIVYGQSQEGFMTANHEKDLPDGAIFEYFGDWKDDNYDGNGEYLARDGLWYVGEYQKGKRHGTGVLYTPISDRPDLIGQQYIRYEGQFKEDQFHGQGKMLQPNGELYVGSFQNGKKFGFGKLFSVNGALKYQGQFVEDNPINL